ncbi:mannosyltransferase [Sinomonas cellulolyticus]|uniref:ABC transporter ATP-binding protein n=1 Tax=Sinomonas cellulolyticus TaxID=2801916 RepID=A0ABS1JXT4_9MICC|nr:MULTISPECIES: ABC transporter ATP-binding protein [Sinomonas]MBL0703907.1 ABC transporter ATP-binding protein [Sinomonas cellulolyticus]GHG57549.1 mannosyltransferase [Sinomonas sp. KCTC 49339]
MASPAPPLIELKSATKRFPKNGGGIHTAIRDVTLSIAPGEFVAVVGPTGCGKSTTLSLISGLAPASEGETYVRGDLVTGIPSGIGYMFQADATLPWKTVLDNVASGPEYRGAPKSKARAKAREWVQRVGLGKFESYYPHQLSGGMRKRVALAQTLVNEPSIMLMDEPFSALDVQTRQLMQQELLRLWGESDAAVVFVTHDLEEAIALADRVVVMTASPATIKADFRVDLERPRNVEEVRLTPEFLDLYKRVWDSLREEVEIARAAAGNPVPSRGEK